jgi:hypothetical protein
LILAAIHLGSHEHPVAEGRSRKMFEHVKSLVEDEVFHTPRATMLAIALATSKTFFSEHLLNEDGQGLVEVLKGDKLH